MEMDLTHIHVGKNPTDFFIVVDFHWAVGLEQRCVLYWYQVDGSIPTFTLDIL